MLHRSLLLLTLSWSVVAAEESVRIATWQGDRAGAFAFTFDDGQREQAAVAAPLLDALGLKATFVINPGKTATGSEGWFGSWDQWRALSKNGHEIGNHSMTHPNFTQVKEEVLEGEIVGAQQLIEKEIGQPCVTFCYPFNAESDAARVIVKRTHAVSTSGERKAYGGPDFTAAKANAWVDEAIAKKSLVIAMIHGIDSGYLPFSGRAVFKDHLDYVKAKESQVWVAPIGVIRRYEQERMVAKLEITGGATIAGAKKVTFTLSCPLEPRIFSVPLTVVIASGAAKVVTAKREGGGEVTATVQDGVILCDVAPGKGAVTVTWK